MSLLVLEQGDYESGLVEKPIHLVDTRSIFGDAQRQHIEKKEDVFRFKNLLKESVRDTLSHFYVPWILLASILEELSHLDMIILYDRLPRKFQKNNLLSSIYSRYVALRLKCAFFLDTL